MSPQELQVREKREIDKKQEATAPARMFMPVADIFETADALTAVLEMPGVAKENVDVNIEDGVLVVEGRLNFSKYEGMQPVYTEYNVGHFRRSFALSDKIDQTKVAAKMHDGVLTVTLPKAEQAKPRKISIG